MRTRIVLVLTGGTGAPTSGTALRS